MSEIIQNPTINQTPNSSTPHVYYLADGMAIFGCLGNPEGVISADPGSIALDNQSIPAVAYLKETGSGNTGWQPFQSGAAGITGSGASPQITYWTGASTVSGNNSWTFDNITKAVVLSDGSNLPQFTISRTTASDPSKIYLGLPSYQEMYAVDAGDGGTANLRLIGVRSGPDFPLSGNISSQIIFGSSNATAVASSFLGGAIRCIATENIGLANGGHGFTWSTTPNGSTTDTNVININKYGVVQIGANGTAPSAELGGSGLPFRVVIGNLTTYNTDTGVQIANPVTAVDQKTLVIQANAGQTASIIETQSSGGGGQFQVRVVPTASHHFLSLLGAATAPGLSTATQFRIYANGSGQLLLSQGGGAYSSLFTAAGGTITGQLIVSTSNAAAEAVGPNGNTNPVWRVVTNTASQANGLQLTGRAAGTPVLLEVISSGANEDLLINPKGTGSIHFYSSSTAPRAFINSSAQIISQNGSGGFFHQDNSGNNILVMRQPNYSLASGGAVSWSNSATNAIGTQDFSIVRHVASVARLTNASTGTGGLLIGTSSETGNVGHLTLGDTVNIILQTTTGSKIGTAVTQKLGFWNATPVVQPASANQAALTDSTGGTPGTTINDVGAVYSQATLNNNFASIVRLLNQIRNDLTTIGIIKGAA